MALARPLACALFICIIGAFALLVHAFVINDFTVRYVAENSNSAQASGRANAISHRSWRAAPHSGKILSSSASPAARHSR
ncbi:hypothetical protein AWI08_16665 [Klebsiella aerogenes]|nr:hypothetical protein AWI08_16665 [Klebsiella aerogenes]